MMAVMVTLTMAEQGVWYCQFMYTKGSHQSRNKAKCLLDAVETALSLLHCHTLYLSRIFYCNKDYINQWK